MRSYALRPRYGMALVRYNLALIARSRLVVMLIGFGLAAIAVSMVLTYLTPGTERRVFFDVVYLGVEILAIVAPILGSTVLQVLEFEQHTAWLVLVRPPSRTAYVWGRFWGLSVSSAGVLAAMGAILVVVCAALRALPEPFLASVMWAAVLEALVISSLSCLVAFVTTSYLTSLIVMLGVVTLGYLSAFLPVLAAKTALVALKPVLWILYWLLPHLSEFAVRDFGEPAEAWYMAMLTGYTLLYAGGIVAASVAIFRRREI